MTSFACSLYQEVMGVIRAIALGVCAYVLITWAWHGDVGLAGDGRGAVSKAPRTIVVALDGSGEFRSIQEAIDQATPGDTIRVKSGIYAEDVTIHSKEQLKLVGEGVEQVTILGQNRVGAFHIGKWPYGAKDIEISNLTINEHGGLAMGIFNGESVTLRNVRINGLLFGQQVQDVVIEQCVVGGSETTGVSFVDSHSVLAKSFIHNNDHGVKVAGRSVVRLEHNVITRSLFEGVVVTDDAQASLVSNTIVNNGGGVAFLGTSRSEVSGNIVSLNKVGFVVGPSSQVVTSYNALYNREGDYLRAGSPNIPAPELRAESDLALDPRFVDPSQDDFRLRPDTPLRRIGKFAFLGALPPVDASR